MHTGVSISDMLLPRDHNELECIPPNVLSQLAEDDPPVFAGQLETTDGQILPITIGQTDIGNGKPTPYIHISSDPSVLCRHVTITAVQTNDGKFRAMLRVNHPHGKVLLGGSLIRPETMYPISDDDEIVLGDGASFRLRLNNPRRGARQSLPGPTQQYIAAPNSDELHENEERERVAKRKQFQDRLTPSDDSLLLQIATAADPDRPLSLVHEMGDTCPYSSSAASGDTGPHDVPVFSSTPIQDDFIMQDSTPMREDRSEAATESPAQDGDLEPADETDKPASEGMNEEEDHEVDALPGAYEGDKPPEGTHDADDSDVNEEEDDEGQEQEHDDNIANRPEVDEDGERESLVDESVNVSHEAEPQDSHVTDTIAAEEAQVGMSTRRRGKRTATAPQLSQEVDEDQENAPVPAQQTPIDSSSGSLMDRVRRRQLTKRGISEITNNIKTEPLESQQSSAAPAGKKKRSSVKQISATPMESPRFSEGPKKLVFLKTAVDIDKATESAIGAVGGKFESKWSDKVDALVTGSVVRTTKFLCAINRGLAIFPRAILTEVKVNKALPPTDQPDLWLRDTDGEDKYGFSLRESILRARAKPMLQNYDVYYYKGGIGEFSADEFKDLVTTAGGKVITRLPKSMPNNRDVEKGKGGIIAIGSETNAASAGASGLRFLNKIEFLVDACIKQKLDFGFSRIDASTN